MTTDSFSLAHSLLISRFVHPSLIRINGDARQVADWTAALHETVDRALERFKRAHLLIPFNPCSATEIQFGLETVYGVQELKDKLRARRLKLSGRKQDLITRLLNADQEAMGHEISALGLYHCSPAGRELADRFHDRREETHLAAAEAIRTKQYMQAIAEYEKFEKDLGFPKWEFQPSANCRLIELLMTVTPKILDGCSATVMDKLRLSIALQCIAGRHAPKHMLDSVETGIRLDAETAERMIYFFARQCEDFEAWRKMNVTHVRHFASVNACECCKSLSGRRYELASAPELPHPTCTNDEYGCRCMYQPILRD